jgi:hypothetical protein
MPIARRKTRLLLAAFFIIVLAALVYIFWYPLILEFQYARIKRLTCVSPAPNGCLEKLWVHRVNSIKRFNLLRKKFHGFEADVVFHQSINNFLIYHPPSVSEGGDTIYLQRMINTADLSRDHLWLDMRGIYSFNAAEALKAFRLMPKQNLIKNACILELYDPGAAGLFAADGYTVSINISPAVQELLANPSGNDSLKRILQPVQYVSQDSKSLPVMKSEFPDKKIATWHLSFKNFFATAPLQELLNDTAVQIILVNIKSPYYR